MSPPLRGQPRDEAAGLRRTMSDLVALSALPAVWGGYPSHRILESLADVLQKTLALDLAYLRFPRRDLTGVAEAVRYGPECVSPKSPEAMGQALAPWLQDPFSPTAAIPHPFRQGTLHAAITRFGHSGGAGVMVSGCLRSDFPTEQERLLLSVGANQAAVAIQRKWVEEQRLALLDSERAARTKAEQASRIRDEFLTTVSHELRTPLSSVLGWAQVARRALKDEATLSQALAAIERGARAQAQLIEDLLDMGRIISGKLRLDVQTVALLPLLEAAVATVLPAAEARDIRIERVLDPLAGPIKGDPARLQQVFWNLLSNAVKFTPKGGKIQLHLERIDSHVEISVSDTGRGIAAEFLPFVFDRFRQADSSTTRRYGGLGLGLALVRQLVELHGGKVVAESAGEGLGATFRVQLPIAIVQQESLGREQPAAAGTGEIDIWDEVRLAGVRLLVIDDDSDTCAMLSRVLQECGAAVDQASSAREAFERLDRTGYGVIVSDVGMPDMDGYELIRRLRARGDKTPAIAVTAFARAEDRIRSLQAGYNMHVSKPLDPRELIAVVASLVRSVPPV
jgi:signal transduction histidine kinase